MRQDRIADSASAPVLEDDHLPGGVVQYLSKWSLYRDTGL